MNKTLIVAFGFTTGAALTLWRGLRRQSTALDVARTNLRTVQRRSERQQAQIAQLEGERELALAKLVQLSHALLNATHQVQAGRSAVAVIGTDLRSRFSRN